MQRLAYVLLLGLAALFVCANTDVDTGSPFLNHLIASAEALTKP